MNTYVLLHEHRHGVSVYHFRSPAESILQLDLKQIVDTLRIDYEPDHNETIEIYTVEPPGDLMILPAHLEAT